MKEIFRSTLRISILSLFIIFIIPIHAQNFEFIAQQEGKASAIGNYGNYTYFCSGGNIHVLEVGTNNDFLLVNHFYTENRNVYDITIDSNKMFVSTFSGILIYDLTEPVYPELLNIIGTDHGIPAKCIIKDTLLLMMSGNWVILYNIADIYEPVYLSSISDFYGRDNVFTTNNNILYGFMQSGFSGPQYLLGHDFSDPENPFLSVYLEVSPHCDGAFPYDMAAKDNLLFVGYNDTLKIYDVSASDTIVYLTQFSVTSEIRKIKLDGDKIYIAAVNSGILIYNISDIFTPELIGLYNQPEPISEFRYNSEYIFCALDNNQGKRI